MNVRCVTGVLTIVPAVSLLLAAVPVSAQTAEPTSETWTLPRTPDGRPNLQGVWANNSATPLERPEALAERESLTDEEVAVLRVAAGRLFGGGQDAAFGDGVFNAAFSDAEEQVSGDGGTGNYSTVWMVDRDFDNRTSLITDPPNGRLPPSTDEAQERQTEARDHRRQHPADGPGDLSLQVRCVTYGVPRVGGLGAGYNSYYQIFQTSGYVAILGEMIHDVQLIPLDEGPHVSENIRQWHGDSRGRWEGDTLVVETTNFSMKGAYRGSSDHRHLVERYTRVGPQTMHYEVTLTDPTTWTRPWTAMVPLKKTDDAVFEYACHEGNYAIAGILAGARADETTTATAAEQQP